MTARNAARIMGLHVALIESGHRRCLYGAFEDETRAVLVITQDGPTPKEAIRKLVEANLARIRDQAIMEQGYRCGICARIKPLSGHHLIPRSHGRRDIRENIIGLCNDCHEKVTNGGLVVEPHSRVLGFLATLWTWDPVVPQWVKAA